MEVRKKGLVINNRTIDTNDDYTINYWIKELNTTKSKLLAAVAEAGTDSEAVKKQLRK